MKNRGFRDRLGFAVAGLATGFARERSFRTHCLFAGLALVALAILRPAPLWWALFTLVIALVLALELVNSALEAIVDLLHPDIHPAIKTAKDMAAAAVLVLSLAALAIALALVIDSRATILGWLG